MNPAPVNRLWILFISEIVDTSTNQSTIHKSTPLRPIHLTVDPSPMSVVYKNTKVNTDRQYCHKEVGHGGQNQDVASQS